MALPHRATELSREDRDTNLLVRLVVVRGGNPEVPHDAGVIVFGGERGDLGWDRACRHRGKHVRGRAGVAHGDRTRVRHTRPAGQSLHEREPGPDARCCDGSGPIQRYVCYLTSPVLVQTEDTDSAQTRTGGSVIG